MRLTTILTTAMAVVLGASVMAWPQSGQGIQLKAAAEVEIKTLDAEGRSIVTRVPAEKVLPGTTVIYSIEYNNAGDQPAGHVTITNPIPQHMRYQGQSAFGPHASITFSIDGGKTFDRPDKLHIVDPTGRSLKAQPEDYTHIRWIFDHPLAPRTKGRVGFRAVLE